MISFKISEERLYSIFNHIEFVSCQEMWSKTFFLCALIYLFCWNITPEMRLVLKLWSRKAFINDTAICGWSSLNSDATIGCVHVQSELPEEDVVEPYIMILIQVINTLNLHTHRSTFFLCLVSKYRFVDLDVPFFLFIYIDVCLL